VRDVLRREHYSIRTEQAYIDWIKRFILYHGKRHPGEMAEQEVAAFLTHLARDLNVAASTQNQALSALLLLYQQFLGRKLGRLAGALRASRPRRVPAVLTREEVRALLAHVTPPYRLIADLICGSGLRLLEALRLRVHPREITK
jgi:integrase